MSTIEQMPITAAPRRMSEQEFDEWQAEDIIAEWARGEAIVHMPEATRHNAIAVWLAMLVKFFSDQHDLGSVFMLNVQFRVPNLRRVPDLCFVAKARAAIVRPTFIDGAPDLVVEIVSPDSVERDWRDKYLEYEALGVREYWVIDLDYQRFRVYHLGADGRYAASEEVQGRLHSQVLSGFWVRATDVWQDPLPNTSTILHEMGVL